MPGCGLLHHLGCLPASREIPPWEMGGSPAFPSLFGSLQLQDHYSSGSVLAHLPACRSACFSTCSLWRRNCWDCSISLLLRRQSGLNICTVQPAVIKATRYSLLLHSPIAARPGLVPHFWESKKGQREQVRLRKRFSVKFCFVSIWFLPDFVHCYLNCLKRNQMQLFLATGC